MPKSLNGELDNTLLNSVMPQIDIDQLNQTIDFNQFNAHTMSFYVFNAFFFWIENPNT